MNKEIDEIIKDNPSIINEYKILEIEYNSDGTKKSFYNLASEKNIKELQIKSDENELDYKYSQNLISKEDYITEKEKLENKLNNQNYVYNNVIFSIIENEDINDLINEIKNANLNEIDLKRLATSLESIAENKIEEFQENNKDFKEKDISAWNYRYDIIAKNYAKTRELESFILSMIE